MKICEGIQTTLTCIVSVNRATVSYLSTCLSGWYSSQTGGTQVTASNIYSYENQTIYAHWTAN